MRLSSIVLVLLLTCSVVYADDDGYVNRLVCVNKTTTHTIEIPYLGIQSTTLVADQKPVTADVASQIALIEQTQTTKSLADDTIVPAIIPTKKPSKLQSLDQKNLLDGLVALSVQVDRSGKIHSLLAPSEVVRNVSYASYPVPEPATITTLVCGAALLVRKRRDSK